MADKPAKSVGPIGSAEPPAAKPILELGDIYSEDWPKWVHQRRNPGPTDGCVIDQGPSEREGQPTN